MQDKDSTEQIKDLQARLEHQEEINRFTLDALELAASLIDFQPRISSLESPSLILDEICNRIARLIDFQALGIYLVDEQDNDFYPAYMTPAKHNEILTQETARLIDRGFFPWAMREKRPVILAGSCKDRNMVLHVLSTSARVRGMFVGLIGSEVHTVPDVSWGLLTIVLSSSANQLESFELYKLFRESNIHLKKIVQERTKQLEAQASYDRLTHLPNRDMIFKNLEKQIRWCLHTNDQCQAAFILVDLDMFKEVNESLGHQTGDRLLVQVGERLQELTDDCEILGRLGGDEFALVFTGNDVRKLATKRAGQMIQAMARPFELQGQSLLLDVSIGIAIFPEHGKTLGQILSRADMAMYAAKRMKTGYAVYDPKFESSGINRLNLMSELKKGLQHDQLSLYFQPKINLHTSRVCGVEALIRWHHPTRGFISPEEFIPLAEQGGLIRELTSRVIRMSMEHLQHWKAIGISIPVSINLSVRDIQDNNLPSQISSAIENHALDASCLELEITESAFMSAPQKGLRVLKNLDSLGIPMGIDDFGTGYSSIAYLRDLPVKIIKIDRSFVMDMDSNDNNRKIVKSIIDLGHNLDLQVVAEGVENRKSLDMLKNLGCDMAQGYFILKPRPFDELTDWLQKKTDLQKL